MYTEVLNAHHAQSHVQRRPAHRTLAQIHETITLTSTKINSDKNIDTDGR